MKQKIKTETVVFELPLVMIGEKDLCMAKSWPEQPGFYIGKNPIGEYCICEKQEGVDTVIFSWLPIQFVEVINSSIAEARLVSRIEDNAIESLEEIERTHDTLKETTSKIIQIQNKSCEVLNEILNVTLRAKEELVEKIESANKDNTAKGGVSEQCLLEIIRTVTK
jgi:hypothetical protein